MGFRDLKSMIKNIYFIFFVFWILIPAGTAKEALFSQGSTYEDDSYYLDMVSQAENEMNRKTEPFINNDNPDETVFVKIQTEDGSKQILSIPPNSGRFVPSDTVDIQYLYTEKKEAAGNPTYKTPSYSEILDLSYGSNRDFSESSGAGSAKGSNKASVLPDDQPEMIPVKIFNESDHLTIVHALTAQGKRHIVVAYPHETIELPRGCELIALRPYDTAFLKEKKKKERDRIRAMKADGTVVEVVDPGKWVRVI